MVRNLLGDKLPLTDLPCDGRAPPAPLRLQEGFLLRWNARSIPRGDYSLSRHGVVPVWVRRCRGRLHRYRRVPARHHQLPRTPPNPSFMADRRASCFANLPALQVSKRIAVMSLCVTPCAGACLLQKYRGLLHVPGAQHTPPLPIKSHPRRNSHRRESSTHRPQRPPHPPPWAEAGASFAE